MAQLGSHRPEPRSHAIAWRPADSPSADGTRWPVPSRCQADGRQSAGAAVHAQLVGWHAGTGRGNPARPADATIRSTHEASGWLRMIAPAVTTKANREPRPRHVTSFLLDAAAMTAGETARLRACPRCRPYQTPHQVLRHRELVCRGVQLILSGALNSGTEGELGALLGVSARHLRRLFLVHLGTTPDQLARLHRAQRACRLLDYTALSVTEIASAAGYGSLRQFNRSFRQAFRFSPSQLRAHRRSTGQLAIAGGVPLRLPYHGLLDWTALTRCLAAQAVPGVERVSTCCYRRTVVVGGDPGVLELRPGGSGYLVLVAHAQHWEELVHIVGRARQIASLDEDPDAAACFLAGDQVIGPLVTARPGVRVPGCWDPFEVGVRGDLTGATGRAAPPPSRDCP